MLKKIILPVVILIFTHQEFYGMKRSYVNRKNKKLSEKMNEEQEYWYKISKYWYKISKYINYDYDNTDGHSPLLWWLWSILDNVPLQYGNSKKIWEHAEAYYGLSNGIGFFQSFLNFGWLKIGIGDAHINVINAITNYIKIHIERNALFYSNKAWNNPIKNNQDNIPKILVHNFIDWLYASVVMTGLHLLSFNFLNCVKIKIISIGAFVVYYCTEKSFDEDLYSKWYFFPYLGKVDEMVRLDKMNYLYVFLSPRIEINISGIINYFRVK